MKYYSTLSFLHQLRTVMMACATFLHLTPFVHTLRPVLRPLTPLFRRLSTTSAGSFPLTSVRFKRPFHPVLAQARRSFPSMAKEEAVASPSDLLFEAPLKVVEYPDPVLRAKNKRVGLFDENLKKLADEMFDVMYRTDGIGLAAPQVGINVELMVFNPIGERGQGEEIVLVNPRIKRFSKKIVPFEEACLSFPGIYANVMRPDALWVDAQDITGARFEINLTGLSARVFQHEYDHIQGIVFFDRMSDIVLDSIRAELQALEKKYSERTGLPSPESIDVRRKKKAVGFGKS